MVLVWSYARVICANYETCAKLHKFHNLHISRSCLPLIISAVTSATMTTKSTTTLASNTVTTTAVSASAARTSKKPVTIVCKDQALCSDPHTRNTACSDKYIAANFCPKMCGICGKYRPRGFKTWIHSQTQNKAQWLAACGHVSAGSQSLPFILSLRLYSSFIT